MARLLLLTLEFSVIFVIIPLVIYFRLVPNLPIPYLLGTGVIVFLVLWFDRTFRFGPLFSVSLRQYLVHLLVRDLFFIVALGIGVWLFAPELLFSLVKRSPGFWLLIMVFYPLLSVFPQEMLYRAYFFHRYEPLFGSGWPMIAASALAFGFVHIIFGNWLAVGLCVAGGLLFSLTYHSSGSLLLACLDHAIFGDFIFTIGLGRFFYHGSHF